MLHAAFILSTAMIHCPTADEVDRFALGRVPLQPSISQSLLDADENRSALKVRSFHLWSVESNVSKEPIVVFDPFEVKI